MRIQVGDEADCRNVSGIDGLVGVNNCVVCGLSSYLLLNCFLEVVCGVLDTKNGFAKIISYTNRLLCKHHPSRLFNMLQDSHENCNRLASDGLR